MELPDLGKQCSASTCQQLDFLPIECQFCNKIFCKEHFPPDYHGCTGDYNKVVTEVVGQGGTLHLCQLPECKDGELTPVICPGCSKNFCLRHRHQVDHQCPAYEPPVNPMAEAAEKIQKITERLGSNASSKGQGRKSDKLSAKVQLMKLKQKSSGQQSLPQEERVYLMILLPKCHGVTSQPVFLSHHWTVGKAIDTIATIARVPNRNNVLGADKLLLFRASDGSRLGSMEAKLKLLLDDQQLFNGQTLILEYMGQDCQCLEKFKDYKI
ncbi:AN1-type zinc finger protein 1-like [Penaeus japonicus]|uniref:AN1-type zinc finger protein 1-like n=1 Tax=Penaeus japonicus TaxID=27405 RepID=UPI001C70C03B|nr:AN1-type zinc finger protein 1-like [Penaeus japonicus]